MLTVVTWKWGSTYTAAHVNSLARQVALHYQKPHRFLCVTNQPDGLECQTIPDREDFASTPSPHGGQFPACYRRLILWHPQAAQWFGERYVCLDIDMTILADVAPLWDRPEDVVLLRDPLYPAQFNGSMLLMTAGARPDVWNDFDPASSPAETRRKKYIGSDQGWISYKLDRSIVGTWGPKDGVYSYRKDGANPPGARIVSYHGRQKAWDVDPSWRSL